MIARAHQPIDRRTDQVDGQVAVYDDDGRLVFLTANPAGDAVRLDDEARRLDAIVAALRLDDTVVRVRRASRADVALFEQLLAEQEAGPDGAQVGAVAVDSTQEAMF